MSIIRRGDKNYFIGLNWRALYMPKKLQAEVEQLIKDDKLRSPLGVVRRAPKDSEMQPQVGFTEDAEASGCYSGASVVANAIQRGLLVEKVAEGLYWIVLVLDSAVVAGTDKIFQADAVEERVREFLAYGGTEEISIYMSESSAEDLPMFEGYVPQDFLGIVEAAEADPHKRDARIVPLKKLPIGKILGIVFLVGGAAGLFWYLNAPPSEQADVASAFPTMVPKDEVVVPTLTDEMRAQARQEEAGWLYQQSLLSPSFVLTALNQQFSKLPLSVSGWSMTSMKFDAANPAVAVVTYRREALGAPYGLVNAIPLEWSFTELADEAEATVELTPPVGEAPSDILALLNSNESRWLDFVDAIQSRGLSVAAGENMTTDRPKAITGLPESAPDAFKRQLIVQQRAFKATGTGWLSASAFGQAARPLSFIAVKSVEISMGENALNWTLNGEVYEHAE